jgi:hypothetical protein
MLKLQIGDRPFRRILLIKILPPVELDLLRRELELLLEQVGELCFPVLACHDSFSSVTRPIIAQLSPRKTPR